MVRGIVLAEEKKLSKLRRARIELRIGHGVEGRSVAPTRDENDKTQGFLCQGEKFLKEKSHYEHWELNEGRVRFE